MIADVPAEVRPGWLQELLARHLDFWAGDTAPEPAPQDEAWKCAYCAFRARCQAGKFYRAQGLWEEHC